MNFNTAAACRIAKVDQAKFNESVHNGNYDIDVDLEGNSRVFAGEAPLVPLWIFGWRLRAGDTPKAAGRYASAVFPLVEALYSTDGYWKRAISKAQRNSTLLLTTDKEGRIEGGFTCDRAKFAMELENEVIEWREIDLKAIQRDLRAGIAAEAARDSDRGKVIHNLPR